MIDENFQDVVKELREIFSQIKGVKNIGEDFSLTYLILTEDDESKDAAIKVCDFLTSQAKEKYGIALETLVVTEKEYKTANATPAPAAEGATFNISN